MESPGHEASDHGFRGGHPSVRSLHAGSMRQLRRRDGRRRLGSDRSRGVLEHAYGRGQEDPLAALGRHEAGGRGKSSRSLHAQRRQQADTEDREGV